MKVYEVKISAYLAQGKPLAAVDTGLTVLKLLGVSLPKKPSKLHVLLSSLGTKLALLGKRIEDLIDLPEMTAPDKLAAIRILARIGSASYQASPNLYQLVIFKGINISVKNGNASFSSLIYAAYDGTILCGVLGNIESGYKFGNLALNLLEWLNNRTVKAEVVFTVNSIIRHWQEHGRQTLQPLLSGYSSGLEVGDLEYALHSIVIYFYYSYCIGQELAFLDREAAKYSDVMQKLKQERSFQMLNLTRQRVLNLMGQSKNPCRLIGDLYDESKRLPVVIKVNNRNALFHIYLENREPASKKPSTSPTTTGSSTSYELDLTAIMKASQTLSEEIVLDKLLAKLMQIIIENAGAQKGFLILETQGKLLIEAEGCADKDGAIVLQSNPIKSVWEAGDKLLISHIVVNDVARTRESVVLNNAANDPKFANSPYIKAHQPKSILCFPLQHQGKLAGIIYLENNLTTDAFTRDRLEVLNLLSSQAAISIENARLYKNLTELSQAFKRFVPHQFLQYLHKESITDVKLGDQVQQEMSVLFSDIRDFTTLSETMSPQDNFNFFRLALASIRVL